MAKSPILVRIRSETIVEIGTFDRERVAREDLNARAVGTSVLLSTDSEALVGAARGVPTAWRACERPLGFLAGASVIERPRSRPPCIRTPFDRPAPRQPQAEPDIKPYP